MRRKKDDKRVLRAGNGRDTRNSRRGINRRSFGFSNNRPSAPPSRRPKKQKKRSGKTVFLMILVLLAFVIGAGMGVMLSFDKGTENVTSNETHIENVTVEMTTNLNDTEQITYDEADAVDYNENYTDIILKDENRVYYEDDIQH